MRSRDPFFSIIVPTYNRPQQLRRCLESLARLDYPRHRYEVILVDDGSSTPLASIIEPFQQSIDIQYIRKQNSGPASARNAGAAVARGRYLAFLDDDCQPTEEWLRVLENHFDRYPDRLLGGITLNTIPDDLFAVTSHAIMEMVYSFFNPDGGEARFFASNNMALSTDLFRDLSGFDEQFRYPGAEDRDLCDRMRHQGGKLLLIPGARMLHYHPMDLRRYCKQMFRYGRGAFMYHRFRAERGSGHFWQDARMHLKLPWLALAPIKQLPPSQVPAVMALLLLWQVANMAGFIYEMLTFQS